MDMKLFSKKDKTIFNTINIIIFIIAIINFLLIFVVELSNIITIINIVTVIMFLVFITNFIINEIPNYKKDIYVLSKPIIIYNGKVYILMSKQSIILRFLVLIFLIINIFFEFKFFVVVNSFILIMEFGIFINSNNEKFLKKNLNSNLISQKNNRFSVIEIYNLKAIGNDNYSVDCSNKKLKRLSFSKEYNNYDELMSYVNNIALKDTTINTF